MSIQSLQGSSGGGGTDWSKHVLNLSNGVTPVLTTSPNGLDPMLNVTGKGMIVELSFVGTTYYIKFHSLYVKVDGGAVKRLNYDDNGYSRGHWDNVPSPSHGEPSSSTYNYWVGQRISIIIPFSSSLEVGFMRNNISSTHTTQARYQFNYLLG